MDTKTLLTSNIPVKVLNKAKEHAILEGFSSVQDVIRILLFNYAEGRIRISVISKTEGKPVIIYH